MTARRFLMILAIVALSPFALLAADPELNAGSKIRGDYYHGAPNHRSSGVRTYSYAPRAVVTTQPQVAPQVAKSAPSASAPANNDVAATDNARRSTRTFSVQPDSQAPTQMRSNTRYMTPRRRGLNLDANRKVLGKYSY